MQPKSQQSVLIIDGNRYVGYLVLSCLAQVPDYKIHVLATDANSSLRQSRLHASFHLADPKNDEDYLETIRTVARKVGATLLMPASRIGIHFAIRNLKALQQIARVIPVPPLDSFETAEDKGKLAEFLKEHDIPTPPSVACTLDPSFFHEVKQLRFPVLLKPNIGTSGIGIREFETFASLEQYLEKNKNDLEPCIIQSKLRGSNMSGNVHVKDGKILIHSFQRTYIPNPAPFRFPSAIKFGPHPEAFALLTDLMAKLNWTGIANIGLFVDHDDNHKVKVLEINPRYWVNVRGMLLAGMNFPHIACLMALDEPLPPNEYKNCKFAEFQEWLNILVYSSQRKDLLKLGPSAIGWPYALQDPIPFLKNVSNKLKFVSKSNRP